MKTAWLPHAQKNAPRYTSYPTAVQFSEDVNGDVAADWLKNIPSEDPISVYVHVPFCEKLCWYCGCHTTIPNGYDRIARYHNVVLKEVDQVAARLGEHAGAKHVHFGGGTPNALNADHMLELLDRLHHAFQIRDDAEIAIELDPRTLDLEMVRALAAGGVTRASLGVQDFNEAVQKAVNRVQPYEQVADAVKMLRNWGVEGLNFDLLYGLPLQTTESVIESAKQAASLTPDRVSAFGYAHVPWFAKHQKAINEGDLPGIQERFDQFYAIVETLESEGYTAIGLDHFARNDDPLAQAARSGALKRNFQGYTDDACETLIAIGPSGISETPSGYLQNEKNTRFWTEAVERGDLTTTRGVGVSNEDRLRRAVIERLMCDMSVNVGEICRSQGVSDCHLDDCFPALQILANDGLCTVNERVVTIPEDARILMRTVAQCFDAYAAPPSAAPRHARAV